LEEPRDENPKLLKSYHVSLVAAIEPALPNGDKKRKGCCYSLTGITSGEVKKRAFGLKRKTCGIFAEDWPEWLTVEGAFHLDLEWVCVSEATFVAHLVRIYPNTSFMMWKPDMILPPVNFSFVPNGCRRSPTRYGTARCSKLCWRRPKNLDLPRHGAGKALLFLSSTLTLAAAQILLKFVERLSGRYRG
jgi:hypothetical protein